MGENRETGASQSPLQPGPGEMVESAPGVQAIIKEPSLTTTAGEKPASPSRRKFLGGLAALAGAVGLGGLIGKSIHEAPAPPQIPDPTPGSDDSSEPESVTPPNSLPVDGNKYGPNKEDILPMMPPNTDNVLARVETGAKAESGPLPIPEEDIPDAMPRMAPKADGPVNA